MNFARLNTQLNAPVRWVTFCLGVLLCGPVVLLIEFVRSGMNFRQLRHSFESFLIVFPIACGVVLSAAVIVAVQDWLKSRRRRFPPIQIPPVPYLGRDEDPPPGGAPVPARLPPKKPAPLAAHTVAIVR